MGPLRAYSVSARAPPPAWRAVRWRSFALFVMLNPSAIVKEEVHWSSFTWFCY
jgi:hypothetical protein